MPVRIGEITNASAPSRIVDALHDLRARRFRLRKPGLNFVLFAQGKPIKTVNGLVSGLQNGAVRSYLGIPFAAPPVGDLRWKAPQAVQNWKGIRACTKFSASPIQNKPVPFSMWTEEFIAPPEPLSEDCLYLNVWTAAKSPKEKRPVLVWIYGGGFVSGSSACAVYDGDAMAQKGVVYVSINYRVGALGFMAHPELTKESGYNASGNYAFLDQIAALNWIKQNIAGFGGDPNNVAIAAVSWFFFHQCAGCFTLGQGIVPSRHCSKWRFVQ